jgi:DNA-binding NarL/FixJ family response regulator
VALARGDQQAALELARAALDKRQAAMREDPHLEILLPAARTIMAAGEPAEQQQVKGELQLIQAQTAQRTLDEQVRARWFRGPLGGELAALAGPFEPSMPASKAGPEQSFDERESRLLRLLVEGRSNREIGEELGLDEAAVARTMTALYARIGTTSRAETTAFAFRTGAV